MMTFLFNWPLGMNSQAKACVIDIPSILNAGQRYVIHLYTFFNSPEFGGIKIGDYDYLVAERRNNRRRRPYRLRPC
jgi:hypothetical protein